MIFLLVSTLSWACDDLATAVDQAAAALLEARVADAHRHLDDAEASLGCGDLPTARQLAAFWLVGGALHHFDGQPGAAEPRLVAARRLDPEYFDDRLGPDLREAWSAASVTGGEGTVVLEPRPEGDAYLDAVQADFPKTVPTGLHLVQVAPGGNTAFARVVFVSAGQSIEVSNPVSSTPERDDDESTEEPVVQPLPQQPPEAPPTAASPWLGVAGVGAALAVGTAAGALAQRGAMTNAEDVDTLRAAYRRQVGLGVTSYAAIGVTVTGVALHLVLAERAPAAGGTIRP